jgi:hypothetical protein
MRALKQAFVALSTLALALTIEARIRTFHAGAC